MLRGLCLFLILGFIASAATIRLYLKDGDYQLVREYQVLSGRVPGRRTREEITVYKSIGHIVQDLATAWALHTGPEELR